MTEGTYIAIIGTMIVFILGALFAQNRGLKTDLKDLAAEVRKNAKEVTPQYILEERFSDITNYIGRTDSKLDNHICRNLTHIINGS